MSWVPRTPRPLDFCGCPPCPICFCWAGDDGLTDGMEKFARDMLGGKSPSADEKQVLQDAAQAIHVANLAAPARIDEELRAADKAQHMQRRADAFLAQKRDEAVRPSAPKKDKRPTLDDLGPEVLEKPKKPEFVQVVLNTAPKYPDYFELIQPNHGILYLARSATQSQCGPRRSGSERRQGNPSGLRS